MSDRGTPRDTTIEEPALDAEHDDTLGTRDEGIDEGGDPDVVDEDDQPVEGDADAETGEEQDDARVDGDGKRAAQVREPSRAQRRVESATRIAAAAKAEAEASRRELAEIKAQLHGRQSQEQQQHERERVALMSPDEKLDYYRQQDKQELDRRFNQLQFQTNDANDRARFDAMCAKNPALQSVADEVETTLAEARKGGANLPRATVAAYLIGQRALERAGRAAPRQRREGAARIARETVRAPNGGGSNVRAGQERTQGAAARAKRLENMDI